MATLYPAPVNNFIQTTLSGAITSSSNTLILTSVAGLQSPGYIIIDRTDVNGTSTPNAREVISYTGITGTQLTGLTRGADGSTARSHADQAVVETMPTVGMWNSLATILATGFDSNGLLRAVISPATISILQIGTQLNISGVSISGFGINPVFRTSGLYSGPTTMIGGILSVPRAGTLRWISIITRTVASGTSVGFDVQKNGVSIFANATTRPAITAGGTFVSTASIATQNIDPGDRLTTSIDSMLAGGGLITDFTIQGGTY